MNGFIELLVNTLAEENCKDVSPKRLKSHGQRVEVLFEKNMIDKDDYKKLNWFRKLRNEAAHEAVFELAHKDFDLFKDTQFENPSYFPALCVDVFTKFWNKNKETFRKLSPRGVAGHIVASVFEGQVFETSDK